MSAASKIHAFFSGFELRSTGKWLALSALVGVVAGVGAVAFHWLCGLVLHVGLGGVSGYVPAQPAGEHAVFPTVGGEISLTLVVAVMTVGGLISGWLVYTFAPEAEGHGTDAAIDAFHQHGGFIRPRIPLVKMISSAVTLGTGGSGGREGPIAQIGAGFGSFLATRLKLPIRDRRILLAAGMGAGVGAIFKAPLAGALFAGEIYYREAEFEADAIIPAAFASIISYTVFCLFQPAAERFVPLFGPDLDVGMTSFLELLPLAVLAVVLAISGAIFIKLFYGTHAVFSRLVFLPRLLRPALGAALAGGCAVAMYFAADENTDLLNTLATGYGVLQDALKAEEALGIGLLLAIAFGKMLTTSLTIGAGGSGGVFGPSMVIGGCLGGAVGNFFHQIWPSVVAQPRSFVIVGMAGFFAGCANAPFSTIIMVSEMTGNYDLLLPAMWVSTLAFLFCRKWTLYEKQVPTRLESPAHREDFIIDVLEGIKVRDVFDPDRPVVTVPESMTLDSIVHMLAETTQSYFPVVDESERLVGIFSAKDVRSYTYDSSIWSVAIARDIMVTDVLSVVPDDDLNRAMRRFTRRNIDELPVLDSDDPEKVVGLLRRKEVIAAYNRQLANLESRRNARAERHRRR